MSLPTDTTERSYDRRRWRRSVGDHSRPRKWATRAGGLVLTSAVLVLTGAATARAWGIETPSKNILCGTLDGTVQCTILRQIVVTAPSTCDGDYTFDGVLRSRGPARLKVGCYGGLVFNPSGLVVLSYGSRATKLGVTCSSSTIGLRCVNESGHGFFLSRHRDYKF
jgi:hypothetical protein